ncbi:MAG: dUTP diphosphatase [Candidatus Enteromonas sp.]|nr:dUTP diphosphatase [Candidatus Enteromonas sp.]
MNDVIVLDDLYPLQKELDEDIAKRHNVSYESTKDKRLLALLVEFGEFANETRCFKYWSLKPMSEKEVVLDEYADGMHFFLSLGIPLGVTSLKKELVKKDVDPATAILEVYQEAAKLHEDYSLSQYEKAFGMYLDLLPLFGFSGMEAKEAYLKKLKVNHTRQENKY